MVIHKEISLRNFEPWSGAVDTVETLTFTELDTIEQILEDAYPEGMEEVELNDFLWFETDTIADWLGFESWEELVEDHKEAEN